MTHPNSPVPPSSNCRQCHKPLSASSAGHWELPHPHADPLVEKIEMAIRVAADLGARAYDAVDGRGLYRSRVEIETDVAALRSASSAARSPDQPSGGTLSEDLMAIASGLEIGRDQAAQALAAHVANIREIASRLRSDPGEQTAPASDGCTEDCEVDDYGFCKHAGPIAAPLDARTGDATVNVFTGDTRNG